MSEPRPGEHPAPQDPDHPSSDPDYSRLQSEAGHLSESAPPGGGPWPDAEVAATPGEDERRRKRFEEIDSRAEQDAAREVRARERSAL